jgi:hypothetical protein
MKFALRGNACCFEQYPNRSRKGARYPEHLQKLIGR